MKMKPIREYNVRPDVLAELINKQCVEILDEYPELNNPESNIEDFPFEEFLEKTKERIINKMVNSIKNYDKEEIEIYKKFMRNKLKPFNNFVQLTKALLDDINNGRIILQSKLGMFTHPDNDIEDINIIKEYVYRFGINNENDFKCVVFDNPLQIDIKEDFYHRWGCSSKIKRIEDNFEIISVFYKNINPFVVYFKYKRKNIIRVMSLNILSGIDTYLFTDIINKLKKYFKEKDIIKIQEEEKCYNNFGIFEKMLNKDEVIEEEIISIKDESFISDNCEEKIILNDKEKINITKQDNLFNKDLQDGILSSWKYMHLVKLLLKYDLNQEEKKELFETFEKLDNISDINAKYMDYKFKFFIKNNI